MALTGLWSRVTGGIVALAVGAAGRDAIDPVLEVEKQQAWARRALRVVGPKDAALAAAKQIPTDVDLADDAKRQGIGKARFDLLTRLELAFPGLGELIELRRRDVIGDAAFTAALRRQQMPDEWIDRVLVLVNQHLTPAQIALGIVRSIIADPGFLPVDLPLSGGVVPSYQQSDIKPLAEAAKWGIDKERLRVMVGEIGLPMSLQQAASAVFRKIIKRADFNRAVLEGDTRPEWADAIFEQAREILTAHDYAELQLRGYLTRDERLAGTRKHGMSDADSDLLYDVLGRSIPVHQIETGEARGGVYDGPIDHIPEPFLASLRRGNLRREYFNLAYANRYSYPSGFMIRGLAQDGELTRAETEQILLEVGWSPHWATTFSERWAGGTGAVADPNVKKAQTQLWTATHRSFVNGEIGDADAEGTFDQLAIPAEARPEILGLWMTERDLNRKTLTPTQIKKAYVKMVFNPATGQAWTYDDALAALERLGMSYENATTFLEI